MAIGRISGPMLYSNLDRQAANLTIDTDLIIFDVINRRIGVNNTTPGYSIDTPGNVRLANLTILGNTITSNTGKIGLGGINSLVVTGGVANNVVVTDGLGNLSFVSVASLTGAIVGNAIPLGANTSGYLVSNAVSLTTTTTVTDGIAQLNFVLGKLVPPSPPPFPGASTLSLSTSVTTGRITNFTQTDNSGWGNLSVAAGTSVSATRVTTYTAGTITNVGPGDSGVVTAYFNGVAAGAATLATGSQNGTYGNLIISADQDYNNVVPAVTAGFWESFSANPKHAVISNGTLTSGPCVCVSES